MSQTNPASPDGTDELRFTHAEPVPGAPAQAGGSGAAAVNCVACAGTIADTYYAAGEQVVCPACRDRYVTESSGGSGVARLGTAAAMGIGAGVVGALIWYGIRIATDMELGIVAVVIGLLVGAAVRAGSQRRGGIGYQLLAVGLTYLTIALSYMPHVVSEFQNDPDLAGAQNFAVLLTAAIVSLTAPVLIATGDLIMLLIYAFALWEAWKMNKRVALSLQGPYTLASPARPAVTSSNLGAGVT